MTTRKHPNDMYNDKKLKPKKTHVRKAPKKITDLCTRMVDLSDLKSMSPTPLSVMKI